MVMEEIRCKSCGEVVRIPDDPYDCECNDCARTDLPIGGNSNHGLITRGDNFWLSNQNDNLMKIAEDRFL